MPSTSPEPLPIDFRRIAESARREILTWPDWKLECVNSDFARRELARRRDVSLAVGILEREATTADTELARQCRSAIRIIASVCPSPSDEGK